MCKKIFSKSLFFFCCFSFLFAGCSSMDTSIKGSGVGGLDIVMEGVAEPDQLASKINLMAYVLVNDDENIYVAEEYEKDVQESLAANISGQLWSYKNREGKMERRQRKPLNEKAFFSKVSSIKWSSIDGYSCEEKPKGFWLPIHNIRDPKKRLVGVYVTSEKARWCIENKYGKCTNYWKEVEGTFLKVKNGNILTKKGKPIKIKGKSRIMSCVSN